MVGRGTFLLATGAVIAVIRGKGRLSAVGRAATLDVPLAGSGIIRQAGDAS